MLHLTKVECSYEADGYEADLRFLIEEAEEGVLEEAEAILHLSDTDQAQALYEEWLAISRGRDLNRADMFVAIAALVAQYLITDPTEDRECPDCRRRETSRIAALVHCIIESTDKTGGTS